MDLSYQIEVMGYAAERSTRRTETIKVATYGLQTETKKTDEYSPELTETKEKEETKRKKKEIAAFPESEDDIKKVIQQMAPVHLAGMFKKLANTCYPYNKTPPNGRRGITEPIKLWDVEISDINLLNINRSQHVQLHGNFRSQGSTHEYGDTVDYTAQIKVWTPALNFQSTKCDVEKLVKDTIKMASRIGKFGPFRHATFEIKSR